MVYIYIETMNELKFQYSVYVKRSSWWLAILKPDSMLNMIVASSELGNILTLASASKLTPSLPLIVYLTKAFLLYILK